MTFARFSFLFTVILAGCSSAPSYNGPTGQGTPATIETFGSGFGLCGFKALVAKNPICEVRVFSVDGKQSSTWASSVEVSPGPRSLSLQCSAAHSAAPGDLRTTFFDFAPELNPGGQYRIEAVWDEFCRVRLVDARTGEVVYSSSDYSSSDIAQTRGANAVGQPVNGGQVLGDRFLRLRVPNSEGWFRISAGSGEVALTKHGIWPKETFAAQVMIFGLKATDGVQELTALIKRGAEKGTPADRYTELSSKVAPSETRRYPCVRRDGVYKDKKAKTGPSTTETLTLQIAALYCRDPRQSTRGFAAIYSHRGTALDPSFESDANAFLVAVVVPEAAKAGRQPALAHKGAQGRLP